MGRHGCGGPIHKDDCASFGRRVRSSPMSEPGKAEPEPSAADPEALAKALEMELIMKRASWQKVQARRGTWRALSFLFLFLVHPRRAPRLLLFFNADEPPRTGNRLPPKERDAIGRRNPARNRTGNIFADVRPVARRRPRPDVPTSFTMGLLQIVHLETNDADAELVRAELKNSAIECELIRARSLPELTSELAQRSVDIILADRPGPADDGLRALTVAREKVPGVPFIFVCGADDSDQVGESLRAGATDFILKDHLSRLVPSIRRVIQEGGHAARPAKCAAGTVATCRTARPGERRNRHFGCRGQDLVLESWRGADVRLVTRRGDRAGCARALADGSAGATGDGHAEVCRKNHHWEGEIRQIRRDGTEIVASTGWTLQGNDPEASLLQLSIDVTEPHRGAGSVAPERGTLPALCR